MIAHLINHWRCAMSQFQKWHWTIWHLTTQPPKAGEQSRTFSHPCTSQGPAREREALEQNQCTGLAMSVWWLILCANLACPQVPGYLIWQNSGLSVRGVRVWLTFGWADWAKQTVSVRSPHLLARVDLTQPAEGGLHWTERWQRESPSRLLSLSWVAGLWTQTGTGTVPSALPGSQLANCRRSCGFSASIILPASSLLHAFYIYLYNYKIGILSTYV